MFLPLLSDCLSKKNETVFPVKVLYMQGEPLVSDYFQ